MTRWQSGQKIMRNRIPKSCWNREKRFIFIYCRSRNTEFMMKRLHFSQMTEADILFMLQWTERRIRQKRSSWKLLKSLPGVFRQCSGAIRHFRKQRHIFWKMLLIQIWSCLLTVVKNVVCYYLEMLIWHLGRAQNWDSGPNWGFRWENIVFRWLWLRKQWQENTWQRRICIILLL